MGVEDWGGWEVLAKGICVHAVGLLDKGGSDEGSSGGG